jgi:hypothetical protein
VEVNYEFMDVRRHVPLKKGLTAKDAYVKLPGGKIEKWDCKPEEATYERFGK